MPTGMTFLLNNGKISEFCKNSAIFNSKNLLSETQIILNPQRFG